MKKEDVPTGTPSLEKNLSTIFALPKVVGLCRSLCDRLQRE